ncbi:DUF4179 domain-containing protein [Bacillus sp. BGMRC 2118]|nr:DUF4179 domain-containing protein [Bacillus sp. BGMRC 2118]
MKEKLFHEEANKIHVPKEDVLAAISVGIEKGEREKKTKPLKRKSFILTAAASVLIGSSLVVPSISHVLAEAPIVGGFYEKFNDVVGRNLESQQLITELDEKATSRGIDVAITSSYFDGAVVGVTFDVKGKIRKDRDGNVIGLYEIFNGDSRISETKELVYLQETKDGWTGQIQISYPYSDLSEDTTLPLTFMSFGNKEGTWKFDVPIKQLPYEEVDLDKVSESSTEGLNVKFNTLIKGNASAAIDYSFSFPREKANVSLEIYDDKQDPIHQTTNQRMDKQKGRVTILKNIQEVSDYIEVYPKISFQEDDRFLTLDQSSPIEIKSNRHGHSFKIEEMKVTGDQFIIDFQVNNGERKGREFMLFHSFARTDVTLVKESRKEIYEEPLEHTIEVLDKKALRFRSKFDLENISDFKKNDYVVRVRLNSLISNIPLELEPIKIDLK